MYRKAQETTILMLWRGIYSGEKLYLYWLEKLESLTILKVKKKIEEIFLSRGWSKYKLVCYFGKNDMEFSSKTLFVLNPAISCHGPLIDPVYQRVEMKYSQNIHFIKRNISFINYGCIINCLKTECPSSNLRTCTISSFYGSEIWDQVQ